MSQEIVTVEQQFGAHLAVEPAGQIATLNARQHPTRIGLGLDAPRAHDRLIAQPVLDVLPRRTRTIHDLPRALVVARARRECCHHMRGPWK